MPAVPVTRNRIVGLLRRQGRGLTAVQVAAFLEMNEHTVKGAMNAARHLKGANRVLYVSRWIRHLGGSGQMTPVFRAGRLPDAPKPEVKFRKEAVDRYNAKRYALERQEKTIEQLKGTDDPWKRMVLTIMNSLTPIELSSVAKKQHLSWSVD
jgi:DNA-binding CsgD family transcriptional regulator